MANLANRGAKAPTSVSDQQDSQKGLPAAVKECRGVSPPWLPGGLLEGHTGGFQIEVLRPLCAFVCNHSFGARRLFRNSQNRL